MKLAGQLGENMKKNNRVKKTDCRIPLRAVVYQHGKWWIAHCLELDLVAEGDTPESALQDLIDLSSLQIKTAIENQDLRSVFSAAPPEIWALFSRAKDRPNKKKPSAPVESFEVREAVLV
jgi:predicted RNase H-like HicB family nuclease